MKSGKKIIRLFSRLNVGGPSIHVINLTASLAEFGYDTLLLVGSLDKFEESMLSYAKTRKVQPTFIHDFQPAPSFSKDVSAFFKILSLIRRERPDIIHTHTFKAGLLGRLAGWISGVPIIVHTYHGHLLNGYWGRRKTFAIHILEKFLGLMTDRIVAVSSQVADDLIQARVIPRAKTTVIELGFDMKLIQEQIGSPPNIRRQMGIPKDAIVAGIVARLVPIKAVDIFLKALCPILTTHPNVHLVIIGSGPEDRNLHILSEDLCHKSGSTANQRIHFVGWKFPVIPELKDLDILVCSSKNEGTSVAIIEGVIAEIPVISTRVGGMADLLENGRHGKLVNVCPEELRSAVEEYLALLKSSEDSPERRAWRVALQSSSHIFKNRFGIERLTREMHSLYHSLDSFHNLSRNKMMESVSDQGLTLKNIRRRCRAMSRLFFNRIRGAGTDDKALTAISCVSSPADASGFPSTESSDKETSARQGLNV